MDELINALLEAPDWLRVRSATVETAEGKTFLSRDDLAGYAFPLVAFTLTVEIAPNRRE